MLRFKGLRCLLLSCIDDDDNWNTYSYPTDNVEAQIRISHGGDYENY